MSGDGICRATTPSSIRCGGQVGLHLDDCPARPRPFSVKLEPLDLSLEQLDVAGLAPVLETALQQLTEQLLALEMRALVAYFGSEGQAEHAARQYPGRYRVEVERVDRDVLDAPQLRYRARVVDGWAENQA